MGPAWAGLPASCSQTLNAVAPTATWEAQFEQAASLWETAANVNLALVPDGGEPVGTNGDQQDDPRFGDIRIGAIPLSSGILAETFLPPPTNGGTDAGDILFNSNANWAINNTYDVMTVAAHEFGHALGLGESTVTSAVMYGTYNGTKQVLTSDDISGIDSIYGAHQYDQFNETASRNTSFLTATNLTSYINSQAQVALAGLDNTTPTDDEWYSVTVPSSTTGQMTVSVQSSNLSSLAPGLMVYNSTLSLVSQVVLDVHGRGDDLHDAQRPERPEVLLQSPGGGRRWRRWVPTACWSTSARSLNRRSRRPTRWCPSSLTRRAASINNVVENPGGSHELQWQRVRSETMPGTLWSAVGNLSGWVALMYASSTATGNLLNLNATAVAPATQTSLAPSSDAGSMGALPSFATTAAAPTTVGLTDDSSTGQDSNTVTATPLPTVDVVFQAVDLVLGGWKGRHRRPATAIHQKHHS